MHWTPRRERYRAVLAGDACIHPGSVFDPISARIAEDLGFEVGMFAGSIASHTVLGAPDLIVLTLTEFAQQAYRINRAGHLPLMVDADHGYGNALSVMRTVQELETAGVAALTIEDTVLPRRYAEAAPTLISLDEGVGKMRAAIAAREDKALCVIGRTSAPALTGIDDAVARARAYEQTGIDGLFIAGGLTRSQLDAISAAVRLPLLLGGVPADLLDKDYLASRRVRIALQGHQPFAAAVQAVYTTLKALRDGTPPGKLEGVAPPALMKQVLREASYDSWTGDFLGG
ncbi:MAG: isocitrate lyase/PEP mutase family protein [Acetobacteraceae bacterium]